MCVGVRVCRVGLSCVVLWHIVLNRVVMHGGGVCMWSMVCCVVLCCGM